VITRAQRLQRLARAQGELVKALEMKALRAEREVATLSAARRELDELATRAGHSQPSLLPSLLRNLSATESSLENAQSVVKNLRDRMREAKSREDAMERRAGHSSQTHLRKRGEEDARETALLMSRKASRKGDVLS
jgi:hypothetical protein